jgi:hypothetical protein
MKRAFIVSTRRRFSIVLRAVFTVTVLTTLATSAASFTIGSTIAYEPFNYSPAGAPVVGDGGNGSTGFANNWYGDSSFTIATGNLTAPVAVPAPSGNRVTAAAFGGNRNLSRDLSQPLGADNSTAYFSFVMEPEGIVGNGAFQGWFGFNLIAGLRSIVVGKDSFHGTYSLQDNLGDQPVETNVQLVSGQPHFFVLAANFLPGNDLYRLYIDPPAGQPQPATAAAILNFDLQTIPTIGLTGPGAFGFDELRIGTTWADVTAVPEPASLPLASVALVVGVAALLRRREGQNGFSSRSFLDRSAG